MPVTMAVKTAPELTIFNLGGAFSIGYLALLFEFGKFST